MKLTGAINVKRLLGESLAIVLSILLAFAIDAWWDDRAERVEEREVLSSLRSDFESNRAEVAFIIAMHTRQIEYASRLTALPEEQILTLPAEEISLIISSLANPWGFDATRGNVDALIGAGKLGILQDRQLREALTTFLSMDDGLAKDRELLFLSSRSVWAGFPPLGGPWLVQHGGLTDAECGMLPTPPPCYLPNAMDYLPRATAEDLLRIREDKTLVGSAHQNKASAAMYVSALNPIQAQIEIVLTLLENTH